MNSFPIPLLLLFFLISQELTRKQRSNREAPLPLFVLFCFAFKEQGRLISFFFSLQESSHPGICCVCLHDCNRICIREQNLSNAYHYQTSNSKQNVEKVMATLLRLHNPEFTGKRPTVSMNTDGKIMLINTSYSPRCKFPEVLAAKKLLERWGRGE